MVQGSPHDLVAVANGHKLKFGKDHPPPFSLLSPQQPAGTQADPTARLLRVFASSLDTWVMSGGGSVAFITRSVARALLGGGTLGGGTTGTGAFSATVVALATTLQDVLWVGQWLR